MLTKVIVKFKDIDKIGREKAKKRCKILRSSVTEAFQEVNQMFLLWDCSRGSMRQIHNVKGYIQIKEHKRRVHVAELSMTLKGSSHTKLSAKLKIN